MKSIVFAVRKIYSGLNIIMEDLIIEDMEIIKQSGVIPFFVEEGIFKVVMISSRSGKKWIFPKGYIEFGYTARESAAKEAHEEAGIYGEVLKKPVGSFDYHRNGLVHEVIMYPMIIEKISDLWPEKDYRTRFIVNFDEVSEYIKDKKILKLLKKVREIVKLK